ncbi:MAG: tol-pal system protein YbgF [Gammaproteobacteria bacterium]|nr:tol-pal system protein YbgF [Gammaproteobacteria bacterium]
MIRSSTRALACGLIAAGCLVSVSLLAAPPVDTSSMTIDQRIKRLERMAENQNAAQLQASIDRLEREAESLRGDLDEARHALEQLKRQQKDLYMDADQRLQQLESGGGSSKGGVAVGVQSDEAAPAESVSELSLDEAGTYQKAFAELKAGQYQQALATFQGFLQTYPDGAYADNAQYWLGEVYYVMRNYPAAIEEFAKVIKNFPDSSKVSDAYLKSGFAYYELKDWKKAQQSLTQVLQKFPSSSAARLAERRVQQMKLDGQL